MFMKIKYLALGIALISVITTHAQRRQRNTSNDTISSNYNPADLFAPTFYTNRGNDTHAANGDPGPKYWQNRADYILKASIDTAKQSLTASENITYTNNSPNVLSNLWLQLDQNTYKPDARSNYVTGKQPAFNQRTSGY